ncbi:hypothetical protein B0H16DRAFT_1900566 [Mycena metata]|uniref:Uncharacterized protein n=1 Tax=Mycena metata TaxID=1033252 RepID=A0AAD7MDD9_9AGAR|nr:hypothetical protein B0H16DRAFT_1900566 [Mycena metata]
MDAFAPIDFTAATACDPLATSAFDSIDVDALPRDEERIGAGTAIATDTYPPYPPSRPYPHLHATHHPPSSFPAPARLVWSRVLSPASFVALQADLSPHHTTPHPILLSLCPSPAHRGHRRSFLSS